MPLCDFRFKQTLAFVVNYTGLPARSFYVLIITLISFNPAVEAQQVSPFQTGHYSPAFSNVRDMATPPPGLFILMYNNYSYTDTYYDRNGNKFNTLSLSEHDPSYPDLDVDLDLKAFATVPAIFWASNFKILGGARYMAGITLVYMSADASILVEGRGGIEDPDISQSQGGKLSGFSDLMIVPLGLSWGHEKFDLTFMYSVTAPTGRYETGGDDNLGLGFGQTSFKVLGKVPSSCSERQSGMNLTYKNKKSGVVTTLIGKMSDQAQLSGLLNSLHELHMSVLSVEKLNTNI